MRSILQLTIKITKRKKKKRKRKNSSSKSQKNPSACGYLELAGNQFSRAFAALAGIFNPSFNDLFAPAAKIPANTIPSLVGIARYRYHVDSFKDSGQPAQGWHQGKHLTHLSQLPPAANISRAGLLPPDAGTSLDILTSSPSDNRRRIANA
jgi:hypothetical protein